jgi:hypothetical protein
MINKEKRLEAANLNASKIHAGSRHPKSSKSSRLVSGRAPHLGMSSDNFLVGEPVAAAPLVVSNLLF